MLTQRQLKQMIHGVDLSEHPNNHIPAEYLHVFNSLASKTHWATIGDLHANALKLLYFMVLMGAAFITEADYADFVKIYQNSNLPKGTFDFKKIHVSCGSRIRLLGDELADRALGGDDFVLELTHAFKMGGGILEIILSNHTVVFTQLIENSLLYANKSGQFNHKKFIKFFTKNVTHAMAVEYVLSLNDMANRLRHAYSLDKDNNTDENGKRAVNQLLALYNSHKSSFKAFSYDYTDDQQLIIYSHAPVSRCDIFSIAAQMYAHMNDEEKRTINEIAAKLPNIDEDKFFEIYENTPYVPDTDLLKLIDIINRITQTKIKENKLHTILSVGTGDSLLFQSFQNRQDPIDNTIINIHGHTPLVYGNRESLDNQLGQYVLTKNDLITIANLPHGDEKNIYALSFTKTRPMKLLAKSGKADRDSPVTFSYGNKERESEWDKMKLHIKTFEFS